MVHTLKNSHPEENLSIRVSPYISATIINSYSKHRIIAYSVGGGGGVAVGGVAAGGMSVGVAAGGVAAGG